jgi:glycosyltransferase involved in cell wall biosynthesis
MINNQKSKLRLAHVLAGAPFGGAENFYTRLVCELAAEKVFTQCAFTRPHELRKQRFELVSVEMQTFKFGSAIHWLDHWKYRKALRNYAPDIVMTYMNRATIITPSGDYKLVARLGHYYDLKYYQHCDYWIGITKGICNYLINAGLPADRIAHIPNFVDESEVAPLAKNSFATPTEQTVLFALGRLHEHKGFDVLLRALPAIDNTVLWLAGDGPEKQRLENLAAELGITERVRFLGWRSDANALMRTADIFVCPSRHEGLGSIIIEAWFNRCPMVATESQGPKELITNEKNGLLTPIDDVVRLAEAITSLINDPTKAKALAEQGYQEYQRYYSRDHIINQYNAFFERISSS